MTFSPDGKTLAAGGWGDNTVKLWNVATRDQIGSLEGHNKTIRTLAFSPDGEHTGFRFGRQDGHHYGTWRHGKRSSR